MRLPAIVLEEALKQVQWRGRFQRLRGDRIILDGAHNPEAAAVLVKTWQAIFPGETAEIIFAAARDKDVAGVLTALKSHRGQRREYPRLFAQPANQHLAVARLRSPRATRSRWVVRANG